MDIIDYLLSALSDLANYLLSVIQWVFNTLIQIAAIIWDALLKVFEFAWGFLKSAAGLFRSLWDNFVKRIFSAVLRALVKAHQWLETKLDPILKFLRRVRAIYDRWYRLYIQPVMNMIQRIRRVLAILRFLHIKWAAQLDAQLAKIEGKIAQVVLTIRGILNSMIDVVSTLADPLMLIRRPTAVISFRRVFLSLIRVFTGRPPGFFFPSPKKGAKFGTGFLPPNFNPGDPNQNPLASTYLPGDDGLGTFNGFTAGQPPDDTAVDELDTLDYFDDSLYPSPNCDDPATCLQEAMARYLERPLVG